MRGNRREDLRRSLRGDVFESGGVQFYLDYLQILASESLRSLGATFVGLLYPALFFIVLAFVVKRRQLIDDARRALPETRINIGIILFNVVFIVPLLGLLNTGMYDIFTTQGLFIVSPAAWEAVPVLVVIYAAVFLGDFIGYWRHRLEHTQLLWPSHAVHHSDTQMTWLALERFHPINALTTLIIGNAFLFAIGLPPYAVIATNLVRHYYGNFIHADLPWTYGPLGKIFVSPAMHRWHHASDPKAYNTNFATVFSIFDRMFGTFRVPGPCDAPLGVTDDIGEGVVAQLSYPLKARAYRRLLTRLSLGRN